MPAEFEVLRPPPASGKKEEEEDVYRQKSHYYPLHTFRLPPGNERHYQQQFGDIYFIRLARLKPAVEQVATEAWDGFNVRLFLSFFLCLFFFFFFFW